MPAAELSSNNGRFEYEITIVERVNRQGKRHSPQKHFIKYGQSRLRTGTVYYRLAAFGRTFHLRLKRGDSFVSPMLTVEHVYNDARRLPFAGDLRHCFYRGGLHGDPNSTAVFNLCHGLVSTLLLYFIINYFWTLGFDSAARDKQYSNTARGLFRPVPASIHSMQRHPDVISIPFTPSLCDPCACDENIW